jgi:protein tyrosine phosphatase (PTP) superfamily phosphohydrolase (DUF442 family)
MKKRRLVVLIALTALAVPAGVATWRRASGNLGVVQPGRVYRSAQLDAKTLRSLIRERGIRTVLNLRGANPEDAWYREELAATLAAGATQVDVPLASDQWISREQANELLRLIDQCEYPILIHCEFGAERTGLASAMFELLRPGGTLADARRQFSLDYLFVAIKDGRVMQAHVDAYESWLRHKGFSHTPDLFRRWLASDYHPGSPSREHWPCNPYPLSIATRPESPAAVVKWSANACPERVAIHGSNRRD